MSEFSELQVVDEINDLNQEAGWQTEYRQLCSGPFHALFWYGETNVFSFTREFLKGPLEVMAADQDDVFALMINRPSLGELRFNGIHMDYGDAFLFMPGVEFRAHTKSNISLDSLSIPVSRVADVAEAFDLEWPGFIPGHSRKLKLPREAVDGFTQSLDATLSDDPAEQVLADARSVQALELFVRSVLSPLDAQGSHKQRPGLGSRRNFQNALEFIEANLGVRFSLADLCRHTEVGIRTLERQFVRETGVPPVTYIKARRLNAARRMLLAADPAEASVTHIAHEHGISHMGRFSVEYRRFFGEQPSETLMYSG